MRQLSVFRFAILLTILSAFATGCTISKIQAPYDSFVCFNSSFDHCLGEAQGGELKSYQRASFNILDTSAYVVQDSDAGKVTSTKDQKYQCDFGTISYSQALDPSKSVPAVFVSPVLLRQIGEQVVKLKRVRAPCERLVQAYGYELDILTIQDRLSISQKAIANLSARLEDESYAKQGLGNAVLPDAELASYQLPSNMIVRNALAGCGKTSISHS